MNLHNIYEKLDRDLKLVEQGLIQAIQTESTVLQQASVHLLQAGGKRIRPIFVILAGRFGSYRMDRMKQIAITLELIHMATLVHDDVIDNAQMRRGQPTVKAKWDNQVAMITGDYIFACALNEISKIKDPAVHQVLSRTMVEVCRGEIEQIQDLFNQNQSMIRYFRRIKRKTALLMAISFQLGAKVSKVKTPIERKLYAYGYYIGMAFQMIDDVLDFTGDEMMLGKPAGGDFKQGNITLPLIYALRHATKEQQEKVFHHLSPQNGEMKFQEILSIVEETGGIQFTMNLARRYLNKALHTLEHLPAIEERDSMHEIADFIVQRSY